LRIRFFILIFGQVTMSRSLWLALAFLWATAAHAQEKTTLREALGREIIGPRQALLDLQEYLEPRIPRMPEVRNVAEWEEHARRIRAGVLDKVVFRGAAASWRQLKTRVEWAEAIPGGPGYRIRKLRYEAVPGLWIPALLYEPEKMMGRVPVGLAVNGHDGKGKAAPYKQIRCINMVKRGILVLNVEWLGMGQLSGTNYVHYRMNQLDLCGTSGLAVFYLAMSRALDVLLAQPHADPERVAVSGLSGGGWQTIFISSLDLRVQLANPVAGYSSFRGRIGAHFKDLGDSEQTPCDLATVADYAHLTALRAPRPTLLTYNAKDECCFVAGYALPPLLKAATPIFQLYGQEKALRSHVNHDPGTHNYEKDNRQAYYRMLGDFFFASDPKFDAVEIPCDKEIKSRDDLAVDLPARNADFNTLALGLAKDLPHTPALPAERAAARPWQQSQRDKLRRIVAARDYTGKGERMGSLESAGLKATFWKVQLGDTWTVPVVELTRGQPKATALLLNDAGRRADPVNAERLLKAGYRVLAVDLFYFGEAKLVERDFLFALLVSAVGDRPLGVQASQLAAVARWAVREYQASSVTVVAVGPRLSLATLVGASLEEKAIGAVELHGALGSLKEILEQNRSVDQMPEMFCFGLLQALDVKHLVALIAPRPVVFISPSERAKKEMAGLKEWYALLGPAFDPLRPTDGL
jgi:dienelactone hydrolase